MQSTTYPNGIIIVNYIYYTCDRDCIGTIHNFCSGSVKDSSDRAPVNLLVVVQPAGGVSDDAQPVKPEHLLTHTPNANLPLQQNKANYVKESDV